MFNTQPSQSTSPEQQEALRYMSLVGDKQAELDALTKQIEEAQPVLVTLRESQEALERLTHQISLGEELIAKREEEAQASLDQIAEREASIQALEEDIKRLEQKTTEKQKAFDEAKQALTSARSEHIRVLKAEAKRSEDALKVHEERLEQYRLEESNASTLLTSLEQETASQRQELASVQEAIEAARKTLKEVELAQLVPVDEAKAKVASLSEMASQLEATCKQLEEEQEQARKETEAIRKEGDEIKTSLAGAEEKLADTHKLVDLKLAEITAYKTKALTEIAEILSRARLQKTTQTLADAINSVQES